ncbi:hypothetical protein C923_02428 [Plasmodium falciparum UGT5.1]|uniref:Uncharacterized protein n=1 Tax=Plasmodium falciparum UGT5.1 TaxID=1237627 RepID=W7JZ63_PLAFA|nr:hypothetical protein C923_02428 [Plasmodium falciparum UGT5.1]
MYLCLDWKAHIGVLRLLVKDVGVMIPLIQKINAETNAIKIGNDVTKLENIFDEIVPHKKNKINKKKIYIILL